MKKKTWKVGKWVLNEYVNKYNYIDKRIRWTGIRLVSFDAIDQRAILI